MFTVCIELLALSGNYRVLDDFDASV
jgi:hypothetical protein